MPKNSSPFSRAMEEVSNTIRARKKEAESAPQLRFDEQTLSKPEYLKSRWPGMSKLERMKYIEENGVDSTMKNLGDLTSNV
jgi:hypothetical protein